MSFQVQRLRFPEVIILKPTIINDHRGFFTETYRYTEFSHLEINDSFVQDNYSHSVRNVLRGLHFQRYPKPQGKLVSVIQGRIFDVAVDIRIDSPTFGQWVGVTLSDTQPEMLYVPPGFAHGFCVLSETADVIYKVTAEYEPGLDAGIRWNDPDIGIVWPVQNPILSNKDSQLEFLRHALLEHECGQGP